MGTLAKLSFISFTFTLFALQTVKADMKDILINGAKLANYWVKGFKLSNLEARQCPDFEDNHYLDVSIEKSLEMNKELTEKIIEKDEFICF